MQGRRPATARTNAELLRQVRLYGAAGFALVILLLGADDAVDLWRGRPVAPWEGLEIALVLAIAALTLGLMRVLTQRIAVLEGLVSICMHCKRVRTDAGWVSVERFVSARSDAHFSHGLCPECFEREHGVAGDPPADRTRGEGDASR